MNKHIFSKIPNLCYYLTIDFCIVWFSILFSYKVYRLLDIGQNVLYQKIAIIPIGFACSLFVVLILFITGTYEKDSGVLDSTELKSAIKGISISFLFFTLFFYFGKYQFSRYVILFSYLSSTALIVIGKLIIYYCDPIKLVLNNHKKILIYGAGDLGVKLFRQMVDSPRMNLIPVGFIDDNDWKIGTKIKSSGFSNKIVEIPVLGKFRDIEKYAKQYEVQEVFFAFSDMKNKEFMKKRAFLKKNNLEVSFIPSFYKLFVHKVKIEQIGQLALVSERQDNHVPLEWIIKKNFDMAATITLLILFSPLFALIAVLIKADSKGPVFFKQERVGIYGTLFKMYKFRSMYTETDPYSINPTEKSDVRVTKIGRFLRRSSLDELPQLINVVKGEMALVGPRPEMEFIVKEYGELHRERLKVKPGITGLWQLSGDRKVAIHENMEYDLYYVRNWSFFLDTAILLKTFVFAFKGL